MSAATDLIKKLPSAFNGSSDHDCVIQFSISTPMHMLIKAGACTVQDGAAASPDVTVTMDDADLVALMTGELNAMSAFMTGKLSVDGDLMLAQSVLSSFDASKLV